MSNVSFFLYFLFLFSHILFANPFPPNLLASVVVPPGGNIVIIQNSEDALLNVKTNMPQAGWTLMRNNATVYSGQGNLSSYGIAEGSNYYILPALLEGYRVKISPQQPFRIYRGQRVHIEIVYEKIQELIRPTSIHVNVNIPGAIFLLRAAKDAKAWKGEGREYIFSELLAGTYLLSFSSDNPEYYIPPNEMRLSLNTYENLEVKAAYQIGGKLRVHTNREANKISFQPIGSTQKTIQKEMVGLMGEFTLPEGRYRVSLSAGSIDRTSSAKYTAPAPIEVRVEGLKETDLELLYKVEAAVSKEKLKNLSATANSAENEFLVQKMILVPAGAVLLGDATSEIDVNAQKAKKISVDAFTIAIYEVTNAQYAKWLTEALKAGSIVYVDEADARGQILDRSGKLLFKTYQADPYSQIAAHIQSVGDTLFYPLPGKDSYPVIDVTWYGALAYCNDNRCRLPSEAEWEKAGGMASEVEGEPLKKFRYGFGRNEIDAAWANYKTNNQEILHFQVLTTPVGFYNGLNHLPLNASNKFQQKTELAKSPYGLFDMSGNVWEWVFDLFSQGPPGDSSLNQARAERKVAKGGCYDSLAEGVRISERIGLLPDHADAYTGFRVAADVQ